MSQTSFIENPAIVELAIPSPLRRTFDYLVPHTDTPPAIGTRILAPFGKQELIGIVLNVKTSSPHISKLKPYLKKLDQQQLIPSEILHMVRWAADYYQHPVGESLHSCLPNLLRKEEHATLSQQKFWRLTPEGATLSAADLKRAPKQAHALAALIEHSIIADQDIQALQITREALRALAKKALVDTSTRDISLHTTNATLESPLSLNTEQQQALAQITLEGFKGHLLEGATGSGKTEVYLQLTAKVLAKGQQALILIPEIGLTPQTLSRFQKRFGQQVICIHSGLNDRQRLDAWLLTRSGQARVIIGTRSAIFAPCPDLGIIIVDEEHDASYKQQDGLRYSARDMAAFRAQKQQIPLLLGSATPSLESLNNALTGRFTHITLKERAGNAKKPEIRLVDTRSLSKGDNISPDVIGHMEQKLNAGQQVLLFVNRRGYSPVLMCKDCNWIAECPRCSARYTIHSQPYRMHCHHCDHRTAVPRHCPSCHSQRLDHLGLGTERAEDILQRRFSQYPLLRVDRDTIRKKEALEQALAQVHAGEPCILVGTQMLAKGHHFPKVTLVVILDADGGLFSSDFRAAERMGQLLTQVAGRAGRGDTPGLVLIQTQQPDHPLMHALIQQGYGELARQLLGQRQVAQLPPFKSMTLVRAEANSASDVISLLNEAKHYCQGLLHHPDTQNSIQADLLGPLPALIEKRANRYRYYLQLTSASRSHLNYLVKNLSLHLEKHKLARKVRWSIDVDAIEL